MTEIKNLKTEWVTTALASSDSSEGAYYVVKYERGKFSCTCPQHQHKGIECKHIIAFKEALEKQKEEREK